MKKDLLDQHYIMSLKSSSRNRVKMNLKNSFNATNRIRKRCNKNVNAMTGMDGNTDRLKFMPR